MTSRFASTRRTRPVLSVLVAALVGPAALAACVGQSASVPATTTSTSTAVPSTTTPTTITPTTIAPSTAAPDPVDLLLGHLSVEEKVGQLLLPVLSGASAHDVDPASASANTRRTGYADPAEAIAELGLSGVVLLGPNITDASGVTALAAGIQDGATANGNGIGAFVAIDQEGGRVARLTEGVPTVPPARALDGDTVAAAAFAAQTATGLREQGINVDFAPVADLTDSNAGVIGDRSYSADPTVASAMVEAVVTGLQANRVAAAAKHWPGHGATDVDSHRQLPVITVDRSTWEQRERVPFAAAVDAGVAMIMVGHLAYPGLDPTGKPATTSPVLIEELLRSPNGLDYDGVVVTDALDMGAVSDQDPGRLAVDALTAGVDLLLGSPDTVRARAAVLEAVSNGTLSSERLDGAVRRILELKAELGLIDQDAVLARYG